MINGHTDTMMYVAVLQRGGRLGLYDKWPHRYHDVCRCVTEGRAAGAV